jgi:hypothetical protein
MTVITRVSVLLVASATLVGSPVRAVSSERASQPAAQPVMISMELLANRPIVRATINGQGPFAFLLGSEDQRSLVDPELADTLKLKPAKGATELTVDLGFGPAHTFKAAVVVEDIARLTTDFGKATKPRGVLSLTMWKDQLVTVDYSQWKVMLEPGTLPEPNGTDVFVLTPAGEFTMPLTIAEQALECRVDPLFAGGLILPSAAAATLQMVGQPKDAGTVKTRAGALRVLETRLATNVTLGPVEVKTPIVFLADRGDTPIVGTPWLGRFLVTYDLANARVRLLRPAVAQTRH